MTRVLLECGNCGAPLDASANARIVKCAYCGHSSKLTTLRTVAPETPPGWKPPPVWTPPADFPAPSVPTTYRRSARPILIASALVGVLVLGGAGVAVWAMVQAPRPSYANLPTPTVIELPPAVPTATSSKLDGWNGSSPLICGIGEELVIDNKHVSGEGTLIEASISCKLVIKNSTLKGGTVVSGGMSSRIEIESSRLEATRYVVDGAQAVEVRVDKHSTLKSKQTAIHLGQVSRLSIKDSTIEAEGVAIELGTASKLTADGSRISGKTAALEIGSDSDVRIETTTVRGKKNLGNRAAQRGK